MDEWSDEQEDHVDDEPSRVLDQRMIREPIRRLEPRPPIAVSPTATVAEAVALMCDNRVGCVLIVEADRLTGIVTERDLLLKRVHPDAQQPVREIMTPDPETLSPDDPIVYALNKMSVGGFRHVPLVDAAHRPVGVVSVRLVVDYIVDFFPHDVLTIPPRAAQREHWRGRDGG